MKYSLAALLKGRKGRALVPVIEGSPALERAMLKALRGVQQIAAQGIRETILPRYESKLTRDADEESFNLFRLLVDAQVRRTTSQINQLLKLEGRRHTEAWMRNARKAFGVDLASVVKEEDLEDYLDAASLRLAGLVKGMSEDLIRDIQRHTVDALIQGQSAANLKETLRERLGVSDARARLIARDQTAKVASDLNRRRHEDAGLESYVWRTSHDERVRSRHRRIDGTTYKYGEPTGAEEGLPPGQPIQCRCVAQAIVEF